MAAIVGLWLCGHTINLMTLGGLALAVGILVDEATVEIENIHTQMKTSHSIAEAVRAGNAQTAIPRLLAMLCILAVFVPSFFMTGAPRELFVPLSLAVGFAMIASYILSSTFVPVISTWLLKHHQAPDSVRHGSSVPAAMRTKGLRAKLRRVVKFFSFETLRGAYEKLVGLLVRLRWFVIPGYLAASVAVIVLVGRQLGTEIFPTIDSGEFRLRLRAADGTHIDRTERIALDALDVVKEQVGPQNVALTLGYVGTIPSSYPINAVYQFSRGPEEAILRIALKPNSGIRTEAMKEVLRRELLTKMPNVRFSFEPADIVSEVMSFGSPTPIEIAVRGGNLKENREFLLAARQSLSELAELRDVQTAQTLDYPTLDVKIDRERAGLSGATMSQITRSVVAATSSSRFVVPNFWPDPKTGIGYQVQVEIPQPVLHSPDDLGAIPVQRQAQQPLLLRDVAQINAGTMPGQFDRYNMKREVSLTANIASSDLGAVSRRLTRVLDEVKRLDDCAKDELEKLNPPPAPKPGRIHYELRGQIPPFRQMMSGLGVGLVLAVVVIFLLLAANFQSLRLALVTVSTAPAVVAGVVIALRLTGSTLNIQSFIGAIMAIGVAMANAILLVTFAEQSRRVGTDSRAAAVDGAAH